MKGENTVPQPDIMEQGRRRREEDKLRTSKRLQENQQIFELKNYKKMLTVTVISVIITLLSLLFSVLSYYGWMPKYANKENVKATTDSVIETQASTVGKK